MRRILTTLLGTVLFSAFTLQPAPAKEQGMGKSICQLPMSALGLVTACAVGTPIAITRLSSKGTEHMMHDFKHGAPSGKFWSALASVPLNIAKGTVKGCVVGPKNAITNCARKPFSKNAFSMGRLK